MKSITVKNVGRVIGQFQGDKYMFSFSRDTVWVYEDELNPNYDESCADQRGHGKFRTRMIWAWSGDWTEIIEE